MEAVLNTIGEGIVSVDEALTIVMVNQEVLTVLGFERDELIGEKLTILIAERYRESLSTGLKRDVKTGTFPALEQRSELEGLRKDGSVFPLEIRISETRIGESLLFTAALRDITEQKRMENEIVRTQRLRAMGELSAGVSHNLNNILTGILGPVQLLKSRTDDPELLKDAEVIFTAGMRARDLVHRLHLSTRSIADDGLQPVDVNKVVGEAVQAARPRWKDEPEAKGIPIEVETHLEDIPPIRGGTSGLHDIFINLIFNALDAMPKGGKITIHTQLIEEDVQISVSDTGIGMNEETRLRVFEPFFTTKMDVGSGLGLSTAHNTVTRWGGNMVVGSELGAGTNFTLRLPVWTESEIEEETVKAGKVRPGKILVVEDDENVSELLSHLLSRLHEVETASDGRKALEAFGPGLYEVAMIDLGLPGLPGDQVEREMRSVDPCLATVLITGWELREDDPRQSAFDFQIQKPFENLDRVLNVVAQAVKLHDTRIEERE